MVDVVCYDFYKKGGKRLYKCIFLSMEGLWKGSAEVGNPSCLQGGNWSTQRRGRKHIFILHPLYLLNFESHG